MPANMRFCAVQIEVICLLLIQLISTLRSAQFLQTVKKTNTCLSQETFTTCCMNMSHMFKVIMSCEETFYVHGHFPSSSGGCGGLRNPFPKNFAPTLPCSPKFSSFTRTYAYTGYNEETCEAKCFMFGYFKEGIRRTHRTSRRVRFVHSV